MSTKTGILIKYNPGEGNETVVKISLTGGAENIIQILGDRLQEAECEVMDPETLKKFTLMGYRSIEMESEKFNYFASALFSEECYGDVILVGKDEEGYPCALPSSFITYLRTHFARKVDFLMGETNRVSAIVMEALKNDIIGEDIMKEMFAIMDVANSGEANEEQIHRIKDILEMIESAVVRTTDDDIDAELKAMLGETGDK